MDGGNLSRLTCVFKDLKRRNVAFLSKIISTVFATRVLTVLEQVQAQVTFHLNSSLMITAFFFLLILKSQLLVTCRKLKNTLLSDSVPFCPGLAYIILKVFF
jgi:hypothetical protein